MSGEEERKKRRGKREKRRAQSSLIHPSMLRSEVCALLTVSPCSYPRCQHMERMGTCSSWMIQHLSIPAARAWQEGSPVGWAPAQPLHSSSALRCSLSSHSSLLSHGAPETQERDPPQAALCFCLLRPPLFIDFVLCMFYDKLPSGRMPWEWSQERKKSFLQRKSEALPGC